MQRLFIVAGVAIVLLFGLFYSQMRPVPSLVSGIIEADEIRLGSRLGGRVASVLVREGETVEIGQPLLILEPYDLDEREQMAQAQLAVRVAELSKLQRGLRAEEIAGSEARFLQFKHQLDLVEAGPRPEEIAVAQSRLAAANELLTLAQSEFDRLQSLFENNAVSQAEMDRADQGLRVAISQAAVRKNELDILNAGARSQEVEKAKAQAAEAQLAWELAKSGTRQEDIDAATSARDAAEAALAVIQRQKQELTITAPTEGTVDALDLQPGDLLAPNAPVLTLLSNANLWVRAYVPQRFLQVHVGDNLGVTVDSYPEVGFSGVVSFIARNGEFTPGNVQTPDDRAKQVYRIRLSIEDSENRLRPGMTANVWLDELDSSK